MYKITKILCVLLVWFILISSVVSASAVEFDGISIGEEIEIPEDLDFSINKFCSGHIYFMQASACEDGRFVVYSRHVVPETHSKDTFSKVYIDIYDANGCFLEELSFSTPFDLAVEMTESSINIFFYSYVLVYKPDTGKIQCFSIPASVQTNGMLFQELRKREFESGQWYYQCEKSGNGYKTLTRTNGINKQVLIEMPGYGSITETMLPGAVLGITGFVVIGLVKIRRRRRSEDNSQS